ncbi:MAG TPA: hypothetical protein DEP72_02570 [Clostridiales bacterium]|nr:hypothetical protein [Clostridiales bacterium]
MARKQRIHYNGGLYHVMARGNNGEYNIAKDEEKLEYISIIKRYKERYGFRLYAYCIMDNHIHMLIVVDEIPLEKIMQGIQQVYTQRYNKKYRRTGHVFQQRYKAIVCNKDGYLLHLIKYIHFNPIEAGMTETVDYKWSSHYEYIKNKNELVETDYVLKLISSNKAQAIKGYGEYMKEKMDDIESCEYEITEAQINNPSRVDNENRIELLINKVLKQESIAKGELLQKTKVQRICDIRKAIIILADRGVNNNDLAKKLEISNSVISRIKAGKFKRTEYFERVISEYCKA